MLDVALDQGHELTARLRLRPYNTSETYVCFDHKMPTGLRGNKTVPGWLSEKDDTGTALIAEVSCQVESVTEGQSAESLSEDKAGKDKGIDCGPGGDGGAGQRGDGGTAKEQASDPPTATTTANGANAPPPPPAQEKQRRGWLW